MPAGEDQQGTAGGPLEAPLRAAALAAGLLENACAPGSGDPLRLKVVRALARDLAEELEALPALDNETTAVEGALRAADVANLAACAAPELLETGAARAAAYLAAGAVRALGTLADAGNTLGDPPGEYEQNLSKDVRGAVWRVQFAVRQVDEFMEDG